MAKRSAKNLVLPDKKDLLLKQLAKKLISDKTEVVSVWAKNIKALGGSYIQVKISELLDLCTEFLNAFIEILETGNFLKLRVFIEKISHIRSTQGFRLSEVQRAYYSFFDVVKPFIAQIKIKEKITEKDRNIVIETVNDILTDTLFELSEAYYKRLNEKTTHYIDEIEKLNLELKETSINDGLTGCYNHRYFQNSLDSEVARSIRYRRPLSIIMFDIDHFKDFNDKFGHTFGDEVLRQIGDILNKASRGSDTVFRYGGEEFSVILPETDRDQAFICAERARNKIAKQIFNVKGKKIKITISGGVDGFDIGDKNIDKNRLIENADKALYLAKEQGRNQVVIFENKPNKRK